MIKRKKRKFLIFLTILATLVVVVTVASPFASAFSKDDVNVSFLTDANYIDLTNTPVNDDIQRKHYNVTGDNATGNLSFTTIDAGNQSRYAQNVYLFLTLPIKSGTTVCLSWDALFDAPYKDMVQIRTDAGWGDFIYNGVPFTLTSDTDLLWLGFYPFNPDVSTAEGVTHTYSEFRLNIGTQKEFSSNDNLQAYLDYALSIYDYGYNEGYEVGFDDGFNYTITNVFDGRYQRQSAFYYYDADGSFSVYDFSNIGYNQRYYIYAVRSRDLPYYLLPDGSTYVGFEITYEYDTAIPQDNYDLTIECVEPINVNLWFTFENGQTLRQQFSLLEQNSTYDYSLTTANVINYGDVVSFGFSIENRTARTTGYNDTSIAQSDALLYNQGYNLGYDNGYLLGKHEATVDLNEQALNKAKNDGEKIGFDKGYVIGKEDGYGKGYNEGYELGSNGTDFNAVFLSAVQAPITALTGLLNFEIFGVNMSTFVYALFTLCLIVTVIKVAI